MAEPQVQILGAYRIGADGELFKRAMTIKHGGLNLSDIERRAAEQRVREELASVALLEVVVVDRDERFNVDFGQDGSDQAAYDEVFLSNDGSKIIARGFEVPPETALRIAFFLHYFDPSTPLTTSYGRVKAPQVDEMPARLAKLIPYEPVD